MINKCFSVGDSYNYEDVKYERDMTIMYKI